MGRTSDNMQAGGNERILVFSLKLSKKRRKGWGRERKIGKEGKKDGESDGREFMDGGEGA